MGESVLHQDRDTWTRNGFIAAVPHGILADSISALFGAPTAKGRHQEIQFLVGRH